MRSRTSSHSYPADKMLPKNPVYWPKWLWRWMYSERHAGYSEQSYIVTANQRQVYKRSHRKKARAWSKSQVAQEMREE